MNHFLMTKFPSCYLPTKQSTETVNSFKNEEGSKAARTAEAEGEDEGKGEGEGEVNIIS